MVQARELLIEPLVHIPPAQALEGLTADAAHRRVSHAAHSIAEIVAHMTFWQDWFCTRCAGTRADMPQTAAPGWPEVPDGSWPDLEGRFLAGLERAASFGDPPERLDLAITPAIEFPPLANYTIRDALVHIANHNGHHLGQIVVLRQLLGLWPPPGGSYTW
jgi:uncharacterized damage-inducible protein DinB